MSNPPIKIFAFDVETTGVDSNRNCIHQISFKLVVDGAIKEAGTRNVRPHPKAVIEDEALKISGVTREILDSYTMSQKDLYDELVLMLGKYCDKFSKTDKIYLAGFNNAKFDDLFLRKLWDMNGDQYFNSWFWSNSLDAMILATPYLAYDRPAMANFKLATVAAACGVYVDEKMLHDAEYDIHLTLEILKTVTAGLL